jgi:hypothetical protein
MDLILISDTESELEEGDIRAISSAKASAMSVKLLFLISSVIRKNETLKSSGLQRRFNRKTGKH